MTEGKIAIPGWLYIFVGIAIIAYSKFIESKAQGTNLIIFVIIGGMFIGWGIVREFVPRLKAKPKKKELVSPPVQKIEPESTHLHPASPQQSGVSPYATHQHLQPQTYASHPYKPLHKQCPRCHGATSGNARFCHGCGFQFY